MFARRKILDENQGILSSFVKGNKLVGEIKLTGKNIGTPKSMTPNSAKKRGRPLSPRDNSSIEQNKRLHLEQRMDNNSQPSQQQIDNSSSVPLNPELTELKRQIFAGFESMLAPLRKEIKELKDDQKEILDGKKLINENKIAKRFVQNEEKQKKLETRIGLLEDQLLEKNVIFQGIHEEEYEDRSDVKTQIVKAIATTMEGDDFNTKKTLAGKTSIDTVERIGKYNPLRVRPVKVRFLEEKDVDHLFRNRKKLPKGVFIDKEYSQTTEKERRLVRPILRAARRMDKYKGKVCMEGPHLVVDGKHYHRQNLHTLPKDLDPIESTCKTNDTIIGFFGELHPFSNFHPCKFTCDGKEFHSSEQFIQMKAAEYFEDQVAKERIINACDAQECKEIARNINNFNKNEWSTVAEELCEPGITQKFLQNETLLRYLMETGNKTIVESSWDEVWGTGKHIGNKDALNKNKWTSNGLLGKILMGIRDKQLEPYLFGENEPTSEMPMSTEVNTN